MSLDAFAITRRWPARHPDRIQLYSLPTPNGVKVSIALEELELPYEPHLIDIGKNETWIPEYLALNPNGKIPAILDPQGPDGQPMALFESGAIVQLLTEQAGRLAPKPGEPERADFLQWLHFAETQAICLQNLNIQHNFIRPEATRSIPTMKLETKRLVVTARALERRLTGRDHLLDGGFSAVDCMFGFNVRSLGYFLPRGDYPEIFAWWERMQARPACARAIAVGDVGPRTIKGILIAGTEYDDTITTPPVAPTPPAFLRGPHAFDDDLDTAAGQ